MCQAVSPSGDLTTSFDVKVIGTKIKTILCQGQYDILMSLYKILARLKTTQY